MLSHVSFNNIYIHTWKEQTRFQHLIATQLLNLSQILNLHDFSVVHRPTSRIDVSFFNCRCASFVPHMVRLGQTCSCRNACLFTVTNQKAQHLLFSRCSVWSAEACLLCRKCQQLHGGADLWTPLCAGLLSLSVLNPTPQWDGHIMFTDGVGVSGVPASSRSVVVITFA